MKPDAFERPAQRLLREAGFTNVNVSGRSGDRGLDGVGVYRLSLVVFQCKRYADPVGPGAVRDFRGAMSIDSDGLCDLLKEHALGVHTTQRIEEDVAIIGSFFDDI